MNKLTLNANYKISIIYSTQLAELIDSDKKYDVIIVETSFNRYEKHIPFKFQENDYEIVNSVYRLLALAHEHLNKNGSMFVYGIPKWLPFYASFLSKKMTFKYWIALKAQEFPETVNMLPPIHEGILLFVNNKKKFTINKVRYPHIFCSQCGDYLADWGGKKHLRHDFGPIISDVWDDRPDFIGSDGRLSTVTINRLLEISCKEGDSVLLLQAEGEENLSINTDSISVNRLTYPIYGRNEAKIINDHSVQSYQEKPFKKDEIYIGDCIEVMQTWTKNDGPRFDIIFADPPYNLEKKYGEIADDLVDAEYLEWCNEWLSLSAKLLQPNGTLYVLNLPKWSYYHATLLSMELYFQRWIVWDALSDPRGNIMPAHYSLLMYTRHPTDFTFNELASIPKMDQCLRQKCISKRPSNSPKEPVSDIWFDVHRIKHKRDRDDHPCQLPTKLLERTILMSSNPGDLILDPFMGTGTTAIMAKKLGRHFAGIDIDQKYYAIAMSKLTDLDEYFQTNKKVDRLRKIKPTNQPPLF